MKKPPTTSCPGIARLCNPAIHPTLHHHRPPAESHTTYIDISLSILSVLHAMSSAKASGADAGSSNARSREHQQGNQGRSYTVEQKAAVIRIRKCSPTAFYDILGLEEVKKTVTDSEVKKAYRKLSLLTHPDKNGHEHADEAFKMVSRAFGVLGDKEKRERFDRSGVDPDSRFDQAQAQNPFSGFASRGGGGAPGGGGFGGGFQGEEMTPEEMFQRFFGGGGGFGGFGGGPFGGKQARL